MKSFQRRWKGLEITIVAVLVLLLLLLAYLNWAIAILALIIVVAAYLVNYNTLHNRRRLAREQFSAMMKNVTQASNFALQNLPMGIVLVNKQGTLVWNNSVFADWVKVDWNKLQKMSALLPGFRIDKIWGKSGYMTEKYENRYFQILKQNTSIIVPDDIGCHALRHSKAIHLLEANVNLVWIRDFLGHSSVTTTEVYARASDKMKKEALAKLNPGIIIEGKSSWQKDPQLLSYLKSLQPSCLFWLS